ncbi:hypothetical protein AB9N12_18015 [Bacteroides sp. AN502(2024)]|uniref:hypothetical protein n=1 Tax=Bacteroides sp. AN502(2024) TaxID=3160599 RepID=UPI003518F8D9
MKGLSTKINKGIGRIILVAIGILALVVFVTIEFCQEHSWWLNAVFIAAALFSSLTVLFFTLLFINAEIKENDIKERYGGHWSELEIIPCKPSQPLLADSTSEKVLGFQIPEYKIISSMGCPPNFNGDYSEEIILEFIHPLEDTLLQKIELMCNSPNSQWSKEGQQYTLTLAKVDLDKRKDFWHEITLCASGMTISVGRI